MKNRILTIGLFLLSTLFCLAQGPTNRTTKTIVADAIGQLPASNQNDYNKIIEELISTGEEGVLQLVGMMEPQGSTINSTLEYALSGITHFVGNNKDESTRLMISNAYQKAIDKATSIENKAFLVRQLELIGQEEAVDKLTSLLPDKYLSSPAAMALGTMGLEKANDSLIATLKKTTDINVQKNLVLALGNAKAEAAEALIIPFVTSSDKELKKNAIYALGRLGSKASLVVLDKAAKEVNYTMEPTNATMAYVDLLGRLLEKKESKLVAKSASKLNKNASKAGATQTRIAALALEMKANPSQVKKLVLTALKDKNKSYRYSALLFANEKPSKELYEAIVGYAKKADVSTKMDIYNFLGDACLKADKRSLIVSTAFDALLKELNESDGELQSIVALTLSRTGDTRAIAPLVTLLNSEDGNQVNTVKEYLSSFDGNINQEVANMVTEAPEVGKVAAIQLLSARRANDFLDTVLKELDNSSATIQNAAYMALPNLVEEKDLATLYSLLENAVGADAIFVQQAIVSALSPLAKEKQVSLLQDRMNEVSDAKKVLYLTPLAATGDVSVLPILEKSFTEASGEAKEIAFNALLKWQGIESAEILYDIAKDASTSNFHDKAVQKYIELTSNGKITGENRRLLLVKVMNIAKNTNHKKAIITQIGKTNTFLGMIYASEYLDDKELQQEAAHAVMNIALANPSFYGEQVEQLLNKVSEVLNNPDAGYQRQAITKFINETPKGVGFVSIFNGKDLTGWKGLVDDPIKRAKLSKAQLQRKQVEADKQMHKDWKVEDGSIVYYGTGFNNLCTEKQYGDFEMYIDWMLDPAGPEPDGGVYLRGTPQVQIWDTSRTDVGAEVGSGGLYNNQVNESKPLCVADNKLGEWNNLYIKMIGDRVTVKLNGTLVVDNVIMENFWDRSQPIPAIEQLELQAHGSKIYYKNIFVKELERTEPFVLTEQEKKEGYQVLFDGTHMHHWTGNTMAYVLEDGCISMKPEKQYGGNLYTKEEFGDFIFRFEFQLAPGTNNGLGIRTPMEGDAAYVGMELQILDHDHPIYKDITPLQAHGSVYGIIPSKREGMKPIGEWNYQEVVANGDNIKVTLNGVVIVDGNIREATKNGTPDGLEHPGLFNEKGHIAFLGHGYPIKFKNIRIKKLK